ncbi:MAG: hypothetical protein KBC73_18580 [Burkholderiaceae bacterium]|nr:hypothetical protein [Burkholderiaceae bacterium]
MSPTSNFPQSVWSFIGGPLENYDYWAKIVRVDDRLPMPGGVKAPENLPGDFLPRGDIEVHPGDFIFEGERHHDRAPYRWLYLVTYFHDNGGLAVRYRNWGPFNAELKSLVAGCDPDLMKGVGALASCVRFAHVRRRGGLEAIRALSMAAASNDLMSRIAQSRSAPTAPLLGADGTR